MLSEKIKILYPILHYPPVIGGLEQWSRQIAERQGEEAEVFIVTGRVRGERNIETKKNVVLVRTSLFALNDLSHSPLFYMLFAIPCIFLRSAKLARSKKVDVFHCHGFISALVGYALSLLRKTPFVVTEQSIGWSGEILKWLRGMVYRKAFACIGASNATLEEFRKVGVERAYVIPNGVDVEKFRRCENCAIWRKNTRDFTVLGVGRLEKVKGYHYLIEAFQKIKKEIPESRLVLVGDGSERKNLEKESMTLGLKDSVEFLGEIAHDALPHV
ncbi:MAG: glycosyltransferase, partial [Candidatus Spechtbacteria bacterium]|nr:glycosyltransferase [Candidatus Spechtbacteria bacterium]